MQLKERLERGLLHARRVTEGVIKEIETPEGWLLRPSPGANHALWIVGHLAYADNSFTRLVAPERTAVRDDFKQLFGMGSTPADHLSDYPEMEEVLAYFTDRRQALLSALSEMTDEDFSRETPEQAPAFLYDFGSVFQIAMWHEGLHAGQLTIIHRMLGKPPLAGRG